MTTIFAMTLAMAAHMTTALVIVMLVAVVAVSVVMLLMAVLMITYLLPRRCYFCRY